MRFIGGPRDGQQIEPEHLADGLPQTVRVHVAYDDGTPPEEHLYVANAFGDLIYHHQVQ